MYGPGGANPYGVSTPATTVPPTHVEILGRRTANDLRGHSIQAVAAASERFFSDFPNGEFALMDTDSVYEAAGRRHILMCGFFAIINSFQDLKRYDKRVRVPKFEELLDVLENEAAARFMEYGMLDIPYNRFSYDELCVILDEWVKKYWPSCPWGGVRLGVVSPVAPSQLRIPVPNHPNAAKKKLLAPQLPISDPAPTGLPDLVVWIANLSGDHWEGMAKVTQEREKQVLPQTGHDPHAMQSPNHLFQQAVTLSHLGSPNQKSARGMPITWRTLWKPASQLKQKTERKRQGAMAHLRGQRLKHRVTPKVEEDKSQEQKKSAKKTRK
ncbi:hypothetical protein QBC32DRAFT_364517 [Pseudoneurospora amorphoporcata]|uniref:Uncharacterized protein n=1 Tax=Pseudoneurospora amorphoporcata TaxID=241081 RepID=A0AAN6NSJ4_9PEZI|nr:hypothetical protein QBC32DRAFT_364517 [Pseudoneurospora amorphoporcata]